MFLQMLLKTTLTCRAVVPSKTFLTTHKTTAVGVMTVIFRCTKAARVRAICSIPTTVTCCIN